MQSAAHQEKHFQQYIIDRLVEQGWKLGDSKFYDTERAVYPEDLESWIKTSGQQEKWDKLERLTQIGRDACAEEIGQDGKEEVERTGKFYQFTILK